MKVNMLRCHRLVNIPVTMTPLKQRDDPTPSEEGKKVLEFNEPSIISNLREFVTRVNVSAAGNPHKLTHRAKRNL